MKFRFSKGLIFLVLLLAGQQLLLGQTTGKIAGIVRDSQTGEPLMGVNIWLDGTENGASTGEDGDFFIINISPGDYTVNVQMIGYQMLKVENVHVSVNRTANLELDLSSEAITTETVIVQAERISAKKDQTGTVANVSADQIKMLPVENLNQVIDMQAGVVQGSFRGGRRNEVSYLIEGMQVDNSFGGEGKAVDIENETISEVEVIQGTFNAEYGRAMSGVVNAVVKDGGSTFNASASAAFANYFTGHKDIFIGLKNSELNRNQDYKLFFSGPTGLNGLAFVANVRYQDLKGHLNGIRRYNVDDYSDYEPAALGQTPITSATGDGAYVPMNTTNSLSLLGKLTYHLNTAIKTSFLLTYNDDKWQGYDHASKYKPDGRGASYRKSMFAALQLNHMLNKSMFYELKFSYLDNYGGNYLYKDAYDPNYVHNGYNRNTSIGPGFLTGGQDKNHEENFNKTFNGKFDYIWQVNQNHSIKSGFLMTQYVIDHQYASIQNYYDYYNLQGIDHDAPVFNPLTGRIEFPYFKPYIAFNSPSSDFYKVYPYEFSAYIQDKMEFEEMVFNVGLRYDYFNPNAIMPTDWRNPKNQIRNVPTSEYVQVKAKTQFSPRIGLSYQLSDRAVLHFSYGHFFQMPAMYALYQTRSWIINPANYSTTLGNPDLNPQKTVQYEVGLWQELTTEMALEVALYYRDIYDLLSTRALKTYNQTAYGLYTNLDYGNAKGMTVKYDIHYQQLSVFLNYTLQYTRGNADNPQQNFSRAGSSTDPITELIPMSWDQRHTFNLTAGYNTEQWGATVSTYYNSGTPYTWSPLQTSRVYNVYLLPNNAYKPAGFSADLSAFYGFTISNNLKVNVNLNVYNLFDKLNEQSVYSRTGRAYTDVVLESDLARHVSEFNDYLDRIHNPSMYSSPRQVKLGLGIEF